MEREKIILEPRQGRYEIMAEMSPGRMRKKREGRYFAVRSAAIKGCCFPMIVRKRSKCGCAIPILPDMVFFKGDGRVHRIDEPNTEPLSEDIIASKGKAAAVLELKAGSAARFGLKPGDKIFILSSKTLPQNSRRTPAMLAGGAGVV